MFPSDTTIDVRGQRVAVLPVGSMVRTCRWPPTR
jgi:hypothetical protein